MQNYVRLNLDLPPDVAEVLEGMARDRNVAKTTLIRIALGAFKVMHDANKEGLLVGTSRDREALKTVIVAPL